MTKIKCRDYDEGLEFPYLDCNGNVLMRKCSEEIYEAWAHPDCIEDDEFNTVMMIDKIPYLVISSHFDFVEV